MIKRLIFYIRWHWKYRKLIKEAKRIFKCENSDIEMKEIINRRFGKHEE
jgi:hypothetical protein